VTKTRRFNGKLHITPDVDLTNNGVITGMTITNNCARRIKPLQNILEVYSSSKGKATESIGENGVGLKQGCATISDLSFVFMRNKGELSMGVIARTLQRPEGCVLPSFVFRSYEMLDLKNEMEMIFANENPDLQKCVKTYGGGDLDAGITRLLLNFELLKSDDPNTGSWANDSYVFSIVLHEVRHGNALHRTSQNVTEQTPHFQKEDGPVATIWRQEYSDRAKNLMTTLYEELPRHYIHIPLAFDVRVYTKPVQFYYWQRRLIELTVFYPRIDPQIHFLQNSNWIESGYPICVFAGFDPVRLGNEREGKALTMCVYSRKSGRLIKLDTDARALLGLSNGGTNFCQGLTIIVDDRHGKLPLSPTKQDIAFGEEANGDIHKDNLYSWIGAIVNCYYNHHLLKFNMQKTYLTEAVRKFIPIVKPNDSSNSKLLSFMQPTYFADIPWYIIKKRIRNKKSFTPVPGGDTKWRITAPDVVPKPKKRASFGHSLAIVPSQTQSQPDEVSSGLISNTADVDDTISADDDLRIGDDDGRSKVRSKQRAQKSVESSRKRGREEEGSDDRDETAQKRQRKVVSYHDLDDSDDEVRRKKRRRKKKKGKKSASKQGSNQDNPEIVISNESSSGEESDDDSDSSGLERELLDNVGDAVAEAYEMSTPKSEPDEVGSISGISNSPKDGDVPTENERLGAKIKVFASSLQIKNLEVEKLKGDLQQTKAQHVVEMNHAKTKNEKLEGELQQLKNQIEKDKQNMKKLVNTIKEQKETLKFAKREKEVMQRETLHLKERERSNEELLRGEQERVKLLESRVQHYQSQIEDADEYQDINENGITGESKSNLNGHTQNASAGTPLRSLFGANSATGARADTGGGPDGDSSIGSFQLDDLC